MIASCWYEDPEERPSFHELATQLDKVLSNMVGYVELNMELVAIIEDKHSKLIFTSENDVECISGVY